MKIKTNLLTILVGALLFNFAASDCQAAPYADVLCYYEQGLNANEGYWTPENAVSPDGTTQPSGLVSLGSWTDDPNYGSGNPTGLMLGFSTAITNGDGADLYVHGNDGGFGFWEPGYIEVAMETSGSGATTDGWTDETFYLIAPSNYDDLPNDPRQGPIAYDTFAQDDVGYADVDGGENIDLDWAIDMDGNAVELTDIAYVRIRTVTDDAAGIFGHYTTEIDYVEALNGTATSPVPIPGAVWMLGSGLLAVVGVRRKKH
jgi:hypothetical protein